ncbi:hypothetical protein HMPREF1092_01719 [Clostridium thermobutyricum]|uniref:Dual OB-containing domain-containing protein n=1 Tax=Clostridium thermobutyricum TaxID=29372 RepID=N9Y2T1_9CLOT|nr:hypothetical protein [Clostridium thermobutyricum]ENZ02484.1 hypothetical protein HMPREF1092_01719 [Clostridium thermobutyricum]
MEKEVIILTKSDKNGGYCVAGIDKENGKFIRLVSEDKDSNFALNDNDLIYEGEENQVEIMDIIRVQLKGKQNCGYQPENYIIDDNYYIEKVGTATKKEISNYLMNQDYIFYNASNFVHIEEIEKQLKKYSLIMFKVCELKLWIDRFKPHRITANFFHNGHEYSFIKITDHSLTQKYHEKVLKSSPRPFILNNAILVMSLASDYKGIGEHYKIVANIIEEDNLYWGESSI